MGVGSRLPAVAVARAKRLIRAGRLNDTRIADRVGFSPPVIRDLRRDMGLPPVVKGRPKSAAAKATKPKATKPKATKTRRVHAKEVRVPKKRAPATEEERVRNQKVMAYRRVFRKYSAEQVLVEWNRLQGAVDRIKHLLSSGRVDNKQRTKLLDRWGEFQAALEALYPLLPKEMR